MPRQNLSGCSGAQNFQQEYVKLREQLKALDSRTGKVTKGHAGTREAAADALLALAAKAAAELKLADASADIKARLKSSTL